VQATSSCARYLNTVEKFLNNNVTTSDGDKVCDNCALPINKRDIPVTEAIVEQVGHNQQLSNNLDLIYKQIFPMDISSGPSAVLTPDVGSSMSMESNRYSPGIVHASNSQGNGPWYDFKYISYKNCSSSSSSTAHNVLDRRRCTTPNCTVHGTAYGQFSGNMLYGHSVNCIANCFQNCACVASLYCQKPEVKLPLNNLVGGPRLVHFFSANKVTDDRQSFPATLTLLKTGEYRVNFNELNKRPHLRRSISLPKLTHLEKINDRTDPKRLQINSNIMISVNKEGIMNYNEYEKPVATKAEDHLMFLATCAFQHGYPMQRVYNLESFYYLGSVSVYSRILESEHTYENHSQNIIFMHNGDDFSYPQTYYQIPQDVRTRERWQYLVLQALMWPGILNRLYKVLRHINAKENMCLSGHLSQT